jgi:predicted AlkP superfamily phosphohydrolase/phosphomutase
MLNSGSNAKLMIIGLDGATFDLVMPWIKNNKLPVLKNLIKQGTISNLESTIPPITPVAWKTFMTGKNPGSHGTFDFYSIRPGTYERGLTMRSTRRSKTLWNELSKCGKKSCIFNVPHTYPPEKINGYLVSGFLTPSMESDFTYPKEFKKELLKKIPNYRIHERIPYSDLEDGKEKFLRELLEITDVHAKAAEYMISNLDWDFSMLYFKQTDSIGHFFWKYMDKSHPQYDKKESAKYENKILELYQQIEITISKICNTIDKTTNIIIMSDHGFGPFYGNFYVNNWLIKNRYMKLKKSAGSSIRRIMASIGVTPESVVQNLINIGINVKKIDSGSRIPFKRKSDYLKKIFLSFNDVDWSSTQAFSMGYYGPIYINKKGKYPMGIVGDKEYQKIRNEIINKLLLVKTPDGKSKLIDRIWLKEDLYRGEYLEHAPDIIFSMKNFTYASSGLFEFGSKKIFSKAITSKSGGHSLNGILVMHGPDFKKGYSLENAKIVDLFPTVLHLMGCQIPSDVDGKILLDAFKTN